MGGISDSADKIFGDGYGREDVKNWKVGSRRANDMKEEISFVINSLTHHIRRIVRASPFVDSNLLELFRVKVGELEGYEGQDAVIVVYLETSFGCVIVELGRIEGDSEKIEYIQRFSGKHGAASLSLDHIKPIHDALPRVMNCAVDRFPCLSSAIAKISKFVEYTTYAEPRSLLG